MHNLPCYNYIISKISVFFINKGVGMMPEKTYIAIDLKSFYASVECMERGLDPMTTNLVVADPSRTEKTICLAVSPSLKAIGISGRPRLFEVVQKVREVNSARKKKAPGSASDGSLYGDQRRNLQSLSEIHRARGHACLLH